MLEPDADETKALRALTRAREDLVRTKVATGNQLRSELERFWPGPIGLFGDLDSPISLAFLESYPSPADARSLGEKRLAAFLARQRYSGRQQPAQLLAKLRRAPQGRVGEIELGARRQLVLCLVQTLKMLGAQIDTLERQIATSIRTHPDGEIFTSLFKDPGSFITAAEMLAEMGDCRTRYPARDALAGDAGQAAVAIESANAGGLLPLAVNKRLRSSFCRLADRPATGTRGPKPLRPSPRPRPRPPRALRTLGRAWCRIVWRCWQDGVPLTPPATAPCNAMSLSPSPRRRAQCPTQPHPADTRRSRHPKGGPQGRARSA